MRIAFFDSGVGGLSVLHQAQLQQSHHQYEYFADIENAPYGAKPAAEVRDLVFAACDFLARLQPDALVIACNTATAVCIEALRSRYEFPVIGMEPAVKPALAKVERDRVLMMATSLTLQEAKLDALLERIDPGGRCDKLAMDKLVNFAEQGRFDGAEVDDYLDSQLSHYDVASYGAVVLGCTHFIYFRPALHKVFGSDVRLVDGNQGTVRHLFSSLAHLLQEDSSMGWESRIQNRPQTTFYQSGKVVAAENYLSYLSRLDEFLLP